VPWQELERRLSGRPVAPPPAFRTGQRGDGGDSPAWSRQRGGSPATPTPPEPVRPRPPSAERHAHSSFSFLDGASSPEEMAEEAARLGLRALAITDHDGVYGVVRFAEAAASYGLATML